MCLCRSNGTGVVVRRRVAADARLPVAILLPVPSPLSPPPTVTIVFLFAILYFSTVNCCATSPADSVDRTDETERRRTSDLVTEAGKTTSGDRLMSTNSGDVVDFNSQMTTENFEQLTPSADIVPVGNNQLPQMSTPLQSETANSRHLRSSTKPEVTIDSAYVSVTSPFYRSTSSNNRNLFTTLPSSVNDVRQSVTSEASSAMLDDSLTTILSEEESTSTASVFDKQTDITATTEVIYTAANAEILPVRATQNTVESTVESRLEEVDSAADSFDAEYFFTNSISTESNTRRRDDASRRLTPPKKATSSSTSNRTTTSRGGDRKRCLRMRTGGGDSPSIDCRRDDDDRPSGTTTDRRRRRRRLEFCDEYSAYVADFDCASSSLCFDSLCPDVVRLDRLARSMNDQFIDRILNYDCEHRYSGVWNCSACKVTAS